MTEHEDWLREELALSEAEWRKVPPWARPVVVPGERELTQWERDVAEAMAAAGWRVKFFAWRFRMKLRAARWLRRLR